MNWFEFEQLDLLQHATKLDNKYVAISNLHRLNREKIGVHNGVKKGKDLNFKIPLEIQLVVLSWKMDSSLEPWDFLTVAKNLDKETRIWYLIEEKWVSLYLGKWSIWSLEFIYDNW